MEGFKKGFYITSQKKERKPEATLGTSSYTQSQLFSNKQPGIQQEERKQLKNDIYLTPTSEEQPRRQMKSALYQEISEFNPSGQMSMKQLIKIVLNLGRGLKIEAFERKTNAQSERKQRNGRVSYRQLRALNGCILQHAKSLGYEHDHSEGFCYETRIVNSTPQRVKNGTTEYWIDPNGSRTLSLTLDETNPDQKEMHLLWKSATLLSKLSEVPIVATGFLISKTNRKNQIEQDLLQQEWKHVQEDGAKTKT